jgi:hypothetical protein
MAAEQEQTPATHRVRAGAGKVRGGGDAAEQDKPVPECAPPSFGLGAHASCFLDPFDSAGPRKVHQPSAFYGRSFGCAVAGAFLDELEMPKLMRKKRKPLRNDSSMDMEV